MLREVDAQALNRFTPSPVYWRILHARGYWYDGSPVGAGLLLRRGKMRGRKTGPARKLWRPARVIR